MNSEQQEEANQLENSSTNLNSFGCLQEDIVRMPALNSRRPNTQASTSGYNFSSNRQSPPSSSGASFNFASQRHHQNDLQFMSTTRKPVPKLTRNIPVPELVPIKHSSVQSQQMQMSNGYSSNGFSSNFNSQPTPDRRRSVFDFTKKNRVSFINKVIQTKSSTVLSILRLSTTRRETLRALKFQAQYWTEITIST